MWALYKIVNFPLTTLVQLIERVERTLARVSDAIQDAPCAKGWKEWAEREAARFNQHDGKKPDA